MKPARQTGAGTENRQLLHAKKEGKVVHAKTWECKTTSPDGVHVFLEVCSAWRSSL
jgi:hypothetical protein